MKSSHSESRRTLSSVALSLLVCACSSSAQPGGPAAGGASSGGDANSGAQAGFSTLGGSTSGGATSGGNGNGGALAGAGEALSGAGGVSSAAGGTPGGAGGAAMAGAAGAGGGTIVSGGAGGAGTQHSTKSYLCNVFLGVSVTHDWFVAGFEDAPGVENARWEAMASAQAEVSFIQNWADPASTLWNMTQLSPCAQHASTPERVVLVGVNWDYTTQAEWEAAYEKVLTTIVAKFPGVKEVDLMTLLRSPGNVSCGNIESVVQPFIDQAIAAEVSKHPDLVRAAPKVYAPDCSVFTNGGPHFTAAGVKVVAGVYGAYYGSEL